MVMGTHRLEPYSLPGPDRQRTQVMATYLAIGILKLARHRSIAAVCRYLARDATRTLTTLGLSRHDQNGHHSTM